MGKKRVSANEQDGVTSKKSRKVERNVLETPQVAACKCKAGKCWVEGCSSLCKKCGCACDGKDPETIKTFQPGRPPKKLAQKLPQSEIQPRERKPSRKSAKRAKKSIAAAAVIEAKDYKKPKAADEFLLPQNGVETWKDLWDAFGWSKSQLKNMPALAVCQTVDKLWEINTKAWSTIRQRLICMIKTGASILYPKNPQALVSDSAVVLVNAGNSDKALEKVGKVLALMYTSLPKGSLQKRVIAAVLAKGLTVDHRQQLCDKGLIKFAGPTESRAFTDATTLIQGQLLTQPTITRQRITEREIKNCVAWTLTQANVGVLSWGTKTIQLSKDEVVLLPKITRKKLRKHMWDDYCIDPDVPSRVGRTTFYEIVSAITSGSSKTLTPKVVPRRLLQSMKEHFSTSGKLPADFPSDSFIRNRIGALKTKAKARTYKDALLS